MLLHHKRIFLVEDDLANRAIIQMLLERNGAKTAIERWGTGTLARLRAFAPVDLILLDLMFPDQVSGFDVFDDIRQDEAFKYIPIVAVSAMDASVAIPRTQDKGFSGFIAKPVSYEMFAHQVAKVLAGEPVWFDGRY